MGYETTISRRVPLALEHLAYYLLRHPGPRDGLPLWRGIFKQFCLSTAPLYILYSVLTGTLDLEAGTGSLAPPVVAHQWPVPRYSEKGGVLGG